MTHDLAIISRPVGELDMQYAANVAKRGTFIAMTQYVNPIPNGGDSAANGCKTDRLAMSKGNTVGMSCCPKSDVNKMQKTNSTSDIAQHARAMA